MTYLYLTAGVLLQCPNVALRDANSTATILTQEPLEILGPFLHYCRNITGVEWMGLKAICQFQQSWSQSIYFLVYDGTPEDHQHEIASEYFPDEMLTSKHRVFLYFFLTNDFQSVSCEVQPYNDNSGK